ncbi:MAG: double zinc ribbon domain-containing protein [Armatimonadota bacterium]|jgi:ComF family protein
MHSRGIGDQLLDLLFPPRCQVCRTFSADPLCQTCRDDLLFINAPLCPCCGALLRMTSEPVPGELCGDCRDGRVLSGARSAGLHTGTLRDAIIAYKFGARTRLAETFAAMLADVVVREIDPRSGPGLPLDLCRALVPVPLHPSRRRWRGFDQAELLCEELSSALSMPAWPDVIIRVRDTRPQTQLKGASRRSNVQGAFRAPRPWRLKGRSFILVDDVFTTGATLDECARVLKRAGAAGVYALSVSRATPPWYFDELSGSGAQPTGGERGT